MNNLLSSYLLGLWQLFIWLVMSDIAFVNPPPWYLNTDYTQNAVYIQGKTLNIAWGFTAAGNQSDEPVSVYMYQLNETNLLAMGTNEKIVGAYFLLFHLLFCHHLRATQNNVSLRLLGPYNSCPLSTKQSSPTDANIMHN